MLSMTAAARRPPVSKLAFRALGCVYLLLIFGAPAAACVSCLLAFPTPGLRILVAALSPLLYGFVYAGTAGILSLPHQRYIREGKLPRDLADWRYFHRRLYGLCWTSVYYMTPLLLVATSVPWAQNALLRLFGYRGSSKLTTYPDTWIRDLPLLRFADGVYLSNKATIGTNIVLANGKILIGAIAVGAHSCIGHLVMLAPGVIIGARVDVGVGAAIGIKSVIGDDTTVGAETVVEHGVIIGSRVKIGIRSFVGSRAFIGDGLVIPPATLIPSRADIRSLADLEPYLQVRPLRHRHFAGQPSRVAVGISA